MSTKLKNTFLELARLGIGASGDTTITKDINWETLKTLADEQGLSAVILDGIEQLSDAQSTPQVLLLNWIGETLQEESVFESHQQEAIKMASLFNNNYISTYVLKGAVVAECYPKPNHRLSADIDCYLLPSQGEFDAWALGNDLIKANGFEVGIGFYKNSTFIL